MMLIKKVEIIQSLEKILLRRLFEIAINIESQNL